MAKYNIVANSKLSTLSGVGYGNVTLNYNQLSSLYDNNLEADNVNLIASDNLYLEIDFGYRIRLDSFNAYLLSTTSGILDNIDFYYKNNSTDTYTKLYKDYNGEFYYADQLPSSFAPTNLLLTVSGVGADLAEVIANNEEYSVSFGEDGTQTQIDISDSDSSNLSNSHILEIKNTSSEPMVDAYICVDYTGAEEDFYLKISEDDETFIGLEDGVSITNDYEGSNYRWSQGALDNIKIVNRDQIELDTSTSGSVGTYTTQIMAMEVEREGFCGQPYNRNDSSFLITNTTGDISNTSLKVDAVDNDYTMEIRSSNTDPVEFTKLFYIVYSHVSGSSFYFDIHTRDLYTDSTDLFVEDVSVYSGSSYVRWRYLCMAVSDLDGSIVTFAGNYSTRYAEAAYNTARATSIDQYGNIIVSDVRVNIESIRSYALPDDLAEFSSAGNVWVLFAYTDNLFCLDEELITVGTVSNVYRFSVSLTAGTNEAWVIYSDSSPGVFYVSYAGNNLSNIPEPSAKLVAGNYDGGCWIYEDSTNTILKYSPTETEDGEVVFTKTVDTGPIAGIDQICPTMTNDKTGKDGLWYVYNFDVIHLDSTGNIISATRIHFVADSLKANSLGVLVRRHSGYWWVYIDLAGTIINTGTGTYFQAIKTVTYKQAVEQDQRLLPLAEDPVWGSSGTLEWRKVPISGYFLPKTKYHQARLTFRTDEDGKSPAVTGLVIPKPVVLHDVAKNQTKALYVKTEFTGNEQPHEYFSKLRCWWHIQDD